MGSGSADVAHHTHAAWDRQRPDSSHPGSTFNPHKPKARSYLLTPKGGEDNGHYPL